MKKLKDAGARLVVHTVRGDAGSVRAWLDRHGFPYDHVNESPSQPPDSSTKLYADRYVDDRAVDASRPWDEFGPGLLAFVEGYKPPKEAGDGAYQEEAGGSFTHDGAEYDLNAVLRATAGDPVREYPVADLAWVHPHSRIDPGRRDAADLTAPVLVAPDRAGRPAVVDGAHRLARALAEGVTSLRGRAVSPAALDGARLKSAADDAKPPYPEDTCPACGGPCVGACRCKRNDRTCAAGHVWEWRDGRPLLLDGPHGEPLPGRTGAKEAAADGDADAAVRAAVASVPKVDLCGAWYHAGDRKVRVSFGDWSETPTNAVDARLTELLGADNVEIEAEIGPPEGDGWEKLASRDGLGAALAALFARQPAAAAGPGPDAPPGW
jgi:hypothetical protein